MKEQNTDHSPFYHPPFIEGKDINPGEVRNVCQEALEIGRKRFENTALIQEGKIGNKEIVAVREFYEEMLDVSPTLNESTLEHLRRTSLYAQLITELWNEKSPQDQLDPQEAVVLGLIHDLGRAFSHRVFRNTLWGEQFLKKIGFRPDLLEKLPPDEHWLAEKPEEIKEPQEYLELPMRAVIELADTLGKPRKEDGSLMTLDEVFNYGRKSRTVTVDTTGMFPSEARFRENVGGSNWDSVEICYRRIAEFIEEKTGASPEDLVDKMNQLEEALPENEKWWLQPIPAN